MKKWKSSIKEPQISKTTIPKPVPKQPPEEGRLQEDVESVLVYFFNRPSDRYRYIDLIMTHLNCNEQAAQYYIDVLLEREMIAVKGKFTSGKDYYSLTSKGREYVMANKLVAF